MTAYTYGLYRESCTVTMPLPSAGATYSAAPPSTAMTYYYTGTGSVSNLTGKGMGQSYSYGLEGKASVYAMHGSGAGAGTGGTGAAAAVPGPAGTYGISGTCAAYAYNGEYTHETLGLQYLRARYYNMAAGTFTSRDTYAGRIGDILSQNRYTYAENNPVTYADPSGHISIKSAWNAVKTGAKTAASAARAVTSAVTAAVRTGASAVSNAIKGAVSKPTVKLGHLSSKTVNQTPSAYAKVSGASRNQAVQQKAAKSAAWADLVGQPVSMCEAAAAWADWGAEKAAGYVDESLIGNGAMLAALKVKAAECWAYSQLENSIHLIIPEADVERMLRGAGLMLGGGFKSFGGFMLALGSSTISWTGLGVLGIGAGAFVVGAGASDMNQGAEEFFLGMSGDSATPTRNGMSDLFYDGNDTIYHLSTGTAAMAGGMMTPYVNGVYGKAGVTTAGSTAGNGRTAGTTATESGAGNAQTAGRTAGKGTVTKPTVAEAAGGTADDALEQFYDDIFESSYGEQFDPVKEQAIAGPGEILESRKVTLNYQASSGVELANTPGKTTTILGRFNPDTKAIINELNLPQSINFNGNPDGFNLLNVPNNLYAELGAEGFWNEYNKPFLDAAIARGDEILMATPIIEDSLYMFGSKQLTGYGREYFYLLEQGYEYVNGRMVMRKW